MGDDIREFWEGRPPVETIKRSTPSIIRAQVFQLLAERDTLAAEVRVQAEEIEKLKGVEGMAKMLREYTDVKAQLAAVREENTALKEKFYDSTAYCNGEFPCEASTAAALQEVEIEELEDRLATVRNELELANGSLRAYGAPTTAQLRIAQQELDEERQRAEKLQAKLDAAEEKIKDLEQVASMNPRRHELLVAKHSGEPYDEAELEALQEQVEKAFYMGVPIGDLWKAEERVRELESRVSEAKAIMVSADIKPPSKHYGALWDAYEALTQPKQPDTPTTTEEKEKPHDD